MGKAQDREIETIKNRSISVELSDADVRRICEKAGMVGLAVPELLQNFIGDLVSGTYSNGSDERMYANQWFERCWFGMFPENTFLKHLIELDMVETVVSSWCDMQQYKLNLEEDRECYDEEKEFIDGAFADFLEARMGGDTLDLETEMAKVLKWWDEYQSLLNKDPAK